MDNKERSIHPTIPAGFVLAPIHSANDGAPLRICVLTRTEPDTTGNSFVLLRELPGSRVYLGAVCDAEARIQEWVEVWVQTLDIRDLAFSGYQERLANHTFDERWRAEYEMTRSALPDAVIVTGMETKNPSPIIIKRRAAKAGATSVPTEGTTWQICKDDSLL